MNDAEADKVATDHERANEAIGTLREVAKTLKELGDDVLRLGDRCEEAEDTVAELRQLGVEDDDWESDWRSALEDYRRGLLDKDELFQRTLDA